MGTSVPDSACVGVLGAGRMGGGIAQVAAVAGHSVILQDLDDGAVLRARAGIEKALLRETEKDRLTPAAAEAARGRVRYVVSGDLSAFAPCGLVIEAIIERLGPKRESFAALERVVAPEAVLATNTSALSITTIAGVCQHPERVVGLHFFNPAPVMPLVEIVQALTTSAETIATLREFVTSLGKTGVVCKDSPGFIVNRLMVPYLLGAIRALEQGVATVEEIDTAVKLGLRHPMGPFELIDYTGLDINLHVANVFFDEFKDPSVAPPPLLKRMVLAGRLGTKVGRGFYEYDEKGQKKSPQTPTK